MCWLVLWPALNRSKSMSLDLCGLGDDRRRAFLRVKKSTGTLERPVRSPPAPKAHETNTSNPIDFPQPEKMQAWRITSFNGDFTYTVCIVIGTKSAARAKSLEVPFGHVAGPYPYTICIKP